MRDRLIELLDGADLFLRNRANAKPALLNKYDIENLKDIAKVCDEAARALEKAIIPPCKNGDTIYVILYAPISKRYYIKETIAGNVHSINEYWYVECRENSRLLSFGEKAFVNKEDAEKAIKGGIK